MKKINSLLLCSVLLLTGCEKEEKHTPEDWVEYAIKYEYTNIADYELLGVNIDLISKEETKTNKSFMSYNCEVNELYKVEVYYCDDNDDYRNILLDVIMCDIIYSYSSYYFFDGVGVTKEYIKEKDILDFDAEFVFDGLKNEDVLPLG